MDAINKKKLRLSLYALAYIVLTVVIVISAVSMFNNFYYESVYVSGGSMNPTLSGETGESLGSDYGIIDKNNGAKRNVKRFQIVTTYYSKDDTSYKIKRVLVKPNETFKIVDNDIYIRGKNGYGEPLSLTFKRHGVEELNEGEVETIKNYPETTLGPDQYFLAGDNWSASYDSFNVGPIGFDLLVGVVVKMQGKCTVRNGKVVEKEPYADRYFLGVDY